jgi:inositol-1,3,4-trisphosphate 5/6-kinase/inositol-tetrakisphosphate 1-kinase
MTLVPSVKSMSQLEKYVKDDAVMLQEFVQHDGVIVKVYVADGKISASTRPSFKNLDHGGGKKSTINRLIESKQCIWF